MSIRPIYLSFRPTQKCCPLAFGTESATSWKSRAVNAALLGGMAVASLPISKRRDDQNAGTILPVSWGLTELGNHTGGWRRGHELQPPRSRPVGSLPRNASNGLRLRFSAFRSALISVPDREWLDGEKAPRRPSIGDWVIAENQQVEHARSGIHGLVETRPGNGAAVV
jgi:hypothetical protein